GSLCDERSSLALGANEQHATTVSDSVRHELQGAAQGRNGLREIEDVDVVANTKDEAFHLRVPAVLLVAEVNTSFEELTHGEFWQCHLAILLPVMPPRSSAAVARHRMGFSRNERPGPVCVIASVKRRTRGRYMR